MIGGSRKSFYVCFVNVAVPPYCHLLLLLLLLLLYYIKHHILLLIWWTNYQIPMCLDEIWTATFRQSLHMRHPIDGSNVSLLCTSPIFKVFLWSQDPCSCCIIASHSFVSLPHTLLRCFLNLDHHQKEIILRPSYFDKHHCNVQVAGEFFSVVPYIYLLNLHLCIAHWFLPHSLSSFGLLWSAIQNQTLLIVRCWS